ncbi:Gfo/Idh/MocA family oxidoreductase [Hymenobacter sp. BT635]|uniref:Gfo/Idh/MocA family oxidoreductase n=1 Tax=Hymenobacter nitidus TaxID=2880929 RepID=A0ABS8ADW0_9BACT|nr:Gfo/Idh/MocA family oxidoreductase [Hymenobacter nitidus]MCB2378595.1 Gfo/Idh/MocA family oxidoreductase [Hymenobacter nitidus]
MTQIRTGLLAYGMSGKVFHAPFVATHPGFELSAVTERSRKEARQQYPEVVSYDSVEALLADESLELIVVNTPSNTHADFTRQALLAGKHVLLEKPVATSPEEVRELWALARQQGKHLLAYQNRRWDSDFRLVKQVVESGQLGQLIEVTFRYDRFKSTLNPKPFKETPLPGSGLLYDLGPHLLDQAISLFGQPLKSRKTTGRFRTSTQVDDYFSIQLLYSGFTVTVASGLLMADPLPAFVLHGTQGSFRKNRSDVQEAQLISGLSPLAPEYGIEPADQAGTLTVAGGNDVKTTTVLPAEKGDYTGLFDAVYQTIRHDVPYPIREEQLLWQNEILSQTDDVWVL